MSPAAALISALAVGLSAGLASTPHCAAMCGPLCAAVCRQRPSKTAALRYQAGRHTSYAFVGLLAGQLGHALGGVQAGAPARWAFRALIVLSCLWLARSLWRGGAAPDVAFSRLGGDREAAPLGQRLLALLPREPLTLGALSALLPCGALYAALLLAGASGSGSLGAVLMLGFAATSGLSLLAAGVATRARLLAAGSVPARITAVLLLAAAALVLAQPLRAAHVDGRGAPTDDASPAQCH